MNVQELKKEIEKLGVPSRRYSINGHLCSDTYILNEVYYYWEYFYMDERGGQNGYRKFDNENDACTFFLEIMKERMRYQNGDY